MLTVLACSRPIIGGKVAQPPALCRGVLLFCYRCIKIWLLVNTEYVVGELSLPSYLVS